MKIHLTILMAPIEFLRGVGFVIFMSNPATVEVEAAL